MDAIPAFVMETGGCPQMSLNCGGLAVQSMVFGDFTGYSQTEGALFVGGDAVLRSFTIGKGLMKDMHTVGLYVNGHVKFSGEIYNGNIVYGTGKDIDNSVLNALGLYSVFKTDALREPFDFVTTESCYIDRSTYLSQLPDNGIWTTTSQSVLRFATTGDSEVQIWSIDCSVFSKIWSIEFAHTQNGQTLMVNVAGENCAFGGKVTAPDLTTVLFNFYEAKKIRVQSATAGSILAPMADIDAAGMIDGQIVCSSYRGPGGGFNNLFKGCGEASSGNATLLAHANRHEVKPLRLKNGVNM
jgi:choice-of-anchor A domain-containing protein